MALSARDKKRVKAEWNQLIALGRKFASGTVNDLYVIDNQPLLDGAEVLADLLKVIPRAAWTRGKQSH